MHLLEINKENYIGQADPFIFEANGKFYIYTTGSDGIYAYFADDLFGKWPPLRLELNTQALEYLILALSRKSAP